MGPGRRKKRNKILIMKQESGNLTARESLDIIAAMIQEAKGKVQQNSFFFLFWGWIIVLSNLGMYGLLKLDYEHFYVVWIITIPAWIYTFYKVYTSRKVNATTTHFDRISGALWMSYGLTIFSLVFFGYKIDFQLNPVIMIVSAIPTIVSGVILNFRPLIIGGTAFWIAGIIAFLVGKETQPLVGALGIICGYLVPGYLLKNRKG